MATESCGMGVEMLGRDERDALREIECRTAAADPELAALLRKGQRRLQKPSGRMRLRLLVALLLLLAVALLVLGLPADALLMGALAAGRWCLRRWSFAPLEP